MEVKTTKHVVGTGWGHFIITGDDGNEIAFSREAAISLTKLLQAILSLEVTAEYRVLTDEEMHTESILSDLLISLKYFVQGCEEGQWLGWEDELVSAKAAIARAEGR